ncbi:hypothetical protein GBAR_LOCUS30407 [Geodia barretti]|nr:hypothetical protein GBAR_LOCUS30407 [Geodia barretti]
MSRTGVHIRQFYTRISDPALDREAWNNHGLSSERHLTPLQMWSGGMLLNQQYTAVQEVFTTPDSNSTASSSSDTELDSTNTPRALTTINPLANSAVMGVDLYADALQLQLLSQQ